MMPGGKMAPTTKPITSPPDHGAAMRVPKRQQKDPAASGHRAQHQRAIRPGGRWPSYGCVFGMRLAKPTMITPTIAKTASSGWKPIRASAPGRLPAPMRR
jgi:hypothetical protein